jgi:signal transduction histidine kinase
MKLISKTILYYLLFTLPLLAIAMVFSYFLIRNVVKEETEEAMWKEKLIAENMIRSAEVSSDRMLNADSLSWIRIVSPAKDAFAYSDTVIYDKVEEEELRFRNLKSTYTFKNKTYRIDILKATLEEDDLMESLYSSLLIIIGVLMFSFFAVSWLLSKWLWKPFYITIEKLNNYDLKNNAKIEREKSKTREFDQLNIALEKMTEKIYSDFLHQKEFTENASHEMQTPLAVIKTSLELLMQSENLKEREMEQVQVIENSINKLSSLNKALLLLAKIENAQFKESKEVSVKESLEKVLINYGDMAQAAGIKISTSVSNDITVKMNPVLCDILVTNLIQNAIRHNRKDGIISIELKDQKLSVSNTGQPLNIKPEELFQRFKKNDNSKESLGLGLAIVKSIIDSSGLSINYSFDGTHHLFSVQFS